MPFPRSRAKVRSSSVPASRLNPTTSAANIAASFRVPVTGSPGFPLIRPGPTGPIRSNSGPKRARLVSSGHISGFPDQPRADSRSVGWQVVATPSGMAALWRISSDEERMLQSFANPLRNVRFLRIPAIALYRRMTKSATFVTTGTVLFHPNYPPIDLAPSCVRSPMLSSMLVLDRRARATALSYPSSQSTDRGGAGQPGFEKCRYQGRHQACRTVAPTERRALARPRARQAICRKGHRGAQ